MRTVFSNHSMVAHVWAQQNQEHGKGKNMFFEGNAIYSWGKHWTLAFFVDNSCRRFIEVIGGNVIINTQSRSVSTSQHLGEVIDSLTGLVHRQVRINDKQFVHNMQSINDGHYVGDDKDLALISEYASYHHREYELSAKVYQSLSEQYKHSFKRAPKKFRDAARSMLSHANEYNRVINIMDGVIRLPSGREMTIISGPEVTRITHLYEQAETYLVDRNRVANEQKEVREAAREKKRAERNAVLMQYKDRVIDDWRSGTVSDGISEELFKEATRLFIEGWNQPTRLRYRNGNIETSRGADVPLEHAKLLIRACQRLSRSTDTFVRLEPSSPVRVGHFSLDHIDLAEKHIKVGCHLLTFDEINSFVEYASERLDIGVDTSYKLP